MRAALVLASALAVASAQLNFLVMGDWGGVPDAPYTTVAQLNVASALSKSINDNGASFIVILGDNFYDTGVTGVDDARWQETFEDVYTASNLQGPKFKWYITAGNHDHLGNITAQVDYTKLSKRWTFPSLYYTFTKTSPDGAVVQFVMIDTIVLSGVSDFAINGTMQPEDQKLADAQWTWIQQTMAASTADFLIVAGHYPVWSVCGNGPTPNLVAQLKPLLDKYQAHYFSGHDHCEQYIDEGLGPQYHGSGAAHLCNNKEKNIDSVPKGSLKYFFDCNQGADSGDVGKKFTDIGAYATVTLSKAGMQVTHRDGTSAVLYTAPVAPPRSL